MRIYLLLLFNICLVYGLIAGNGPIPDSLLQNRTELIYQYNSLSDSISNSNKSEFQSIITTLNDLISTDDYILENYLPELISQNEDMKEQITELEKSNTEQNEKLLEYEELRMPAIILCGTLLVLFILFLILFTSKTLQLKKIRFKIENYEASYEENKALIENFTKENSELIAKEIELKKQNEKLIQESDAKTKLLKTDLDNTSNENRLLQKRLTELNENFEKEKKSRKSLEDENMQLKEKNFSLEQQLSEIKKNIEKEIQTRKHIEEELKELLNQLKGL